MKRLKAYDPLAVKNKIADISQGFISVLNDYDDLEQYDVEYALEQLQNKIQDTLNELYQDSGRL